MTALLLRDFETSDTAGENFLEIDFDAVSHGRMPDDFLELILETPGDFACTHDERGRRRLSVKTENGTIKHAVVDCVDGRWSLRDGNYAGERTFGRLLDLYANPYVPLLSAYFGEPTAATCLLRPDKDFVIIEKYPIGESTGARLYAVAFTNGMSVKWKEARDGVDEVDNRAAIFQVCWTQHENRNEQEYRAFCWLKGHEVSLPPILGVHFEPLAIVYSGNVELVNLDAYLQQYRNDLNFHRRIKLCHQISVIITQLHTANVVHGNCNLACFQVAIKSGVQPRVVFGRLADLSPRQPREYKHNLGPLKLAAPEVEYTNRLTKETDVWALAGIIVDVLLQDDGQLVFRQDPTSLPKAWPKGMRTMLERSRRTIPAERPLAIAVERAVASALLGFNTSAALPDNRASDYSDNE